MRLHGNQRLLDPGLVPNLNLVTPEKMARRKELEAELGVLTKEVADEREVLRELAEKKDFDSMDFQRYRVRMLELNDKRERRRDLKVDLAMLPDPEARAKPPEPNAFQRWVKSGVAGLSVEERKNFTGAYPGMETTSGAETFRFSDFIRAGVADGQVFMAPDATATRSDIATGKDAVGTTIDQTVLQALKQYGGALEFCRAIRTATGDVRRFLHMDDTSEVGEVLTAQTADVGAGNVAVKGIEMTAKTVTSKFVTVSVEFLADDEAGMPGIIQDLCYRRIGRAMNKFVTLTQTSMPNGIIDCLLHNTVKSGTAGKLVDINNGDAAWQRLIQLVMKVNAAYRSRQGETGMWGMSNTDDGRIGFMMHSSMESIIAQLKDGDNRPVVLPSIREGFGFQIAGIDYRINDQMDEPAANKYPLAFFNGAYYGVRYVGQMMFERFYDSATAANQTVKFLAKTRFDYGPLQVRDGTDARAASARGDWGAVMQLAA